MNKKYSYLFLFFIMLSFVIIFGWCDQVYAESTRFTSCEYSIPKGYFYTDKKSLKRDVELKLVYKNNDLVIAQAVDEDGEITGGLIRIGTDPLVFLNTKLKIYDTIKQLKNNSCLNSIETNGFWGLEGTWYTIGLVKEDAVVEKKHKFTYKLKKENTYSINDLTCKYVIKEEATEQDNIEFPGKISSDRSGYSYDPITITMKSSIFGYTVHYGYEVEGVPSSKLNSKHEYHNRFNQYLFSDKESSDNLKVFERFVKLAEVYQNGCPTYFLYDPQDGGYLATDKIIRSSNDTLIGDNMDYAVYQNDNSEMCTQQVDEQIKIMDAYSPISNEIEQEINGYVTNKNLTKERYLELFDLLKQTEENTRGSKIIDETIYNKYFSGNYCTNVSDNQQKYENAHKTIMSKISDILDNLSTASKVSENMDQTDRDQAANQIAKLKKKWLENLELLTMFNYSEPTCEDLWGRETDEDSLYNVVKTILNYVRIIAPILLIVFGGMDFGKAVISSDQDALKKAQANFIKRVIAALILFFLPTLINLIMDLINMSLGTDMDSCVIK